MSRLVLSSFVVLTWLLSSLLLAPVLAAGDTVHVTVMGIRQTDVPKGSTDPGWDDCLPATVAMVLEAFSSKGTIPASVDVSYTAVRTRFRTRVPEVLAELYPMVAITLVPTLAQNSVAADFIQSTVDGWPDLVHDQINQKVPLIAAIGDWSLLKNGNKQLHPSHTGHFVVVTGIGPDQVTFIDPWDGNEYPMTRADFSSAWQTSSWAALVFTSQIPTAGAPAAPALMSPPDGGAVAPTGVSLQWSGVGDGLSYEVEAWESGNYGSWLHPDPPWQTEIAWTMPWQLSVGPAYIWRARARNPAGQVSPWSASGTFRVEATVPPPTVIVPISTPVPGGAWISPADGSTLTSASFPFSAHAYPTNPGDPPIDHVSFAVWWPALGPENGPWQVACSMPASAAKGDVYGCDWSLQGTPSGQVKVSFDVYDQAGNVNTSPNGKHTLVYQPGNVGGLPRSMAQKATPEQAAASANQLKKIYPYLPYTTTVPTSTGISVDILISPQNIGVCPPSVLCVEVYGHNRNITYEDYANAVYRQAFLEAANDLFSWLRSHGVDTGQIYTSWNQRAVSQNTAEWWLGIGPEPVPPTPNSHSPLLHGTWISPLDGAHVTTPMIRFAVHATNTPAYLPVAVHFTVWWPALGDKHGPWKIACVANTPTNGDVYQCDADLTKLGAPSGKLSVSFDVYDQVGNKNPSPNGERSIIYR